MRKFIALGLGAVTTATLAFSSISPASAVAVTPGPLATSVCTGLPAQIVGGVAALASAVTAQGLAASDLGVKSTALGGAQTGLIAALVGYIGAVDGGSSAGTVATKTAVLNDALSVFVDKATAWGNSSNALNAANSNLNVLTITNVVPGLLQTGLGCVIPAT